MVGVGHNVGGGLGVKGNGKRFLETKIVDDSGDDD